MRTLLLILFPVCSFGQITYQPDIEYSQVIEFTDLSQEEIKDKTLAWIGSVFDNLRSDQYMVTEENITMVYNTIYYYQEGSQQLKVQFKDGKARFVINNFKTDRGGKMIYVFQKFNGTTKTNKHALLVKDAIERQTKSLCDKYTSFVNGEEDW